MDNKIVIAMQCDMQIRRYKGEPEEYYLGRLVYSALSHWIRYIILDEVTQYQSSKSKAYVLKQGHKILENLVNCIPLCKEWIYGNEKNNLYDPVKVIRERMISSGELIEVDEYGNLGLPQYQKKNCTKEYIRVKGLKENEKLLEYVGVTRIQKSSVIKDNLTNLNMIKSIPYVDWLYKNANWSECTNIENFEIFNPFSKKAPYQSWVDNVIKSVEYCFGRLTLFNGMHEYYLLKNKSGRWLNYQLPPVLAEYKEERRIILGLRNKYGNPMNATYSLIESIVIINLHCRLPLREQDIIETFCWPLNGFNDRLNYVVPEKIWILVRDLLVNELGIELKEKK